MLCSKYPGGIGIRDQVGANSIHLAVQCRTQSNNRSNDDILKILLENLPKDRKQFLKIINQKTNLGQTPLQAAVIEKNVRSVRLLLASGCDINIRDSFLTSPLENSIRLGCNEIVTLLLYAGAKTDNLVCKGSLTFDCADDEIRKRLIKHATQPPSLANLCRRTLVVSQGAEISSDSYELPKQWKRFLSFHTLILR